MTDLKTNDFVQVGYTKFLANGEEELCWLNALYVCCNSKGHHVAIYSDGTREVLNYRQKVRKVRLEEE